MMEVLTIKKKMSQQNSLIIPWHDMTKFPDNSLTWVKWPKFPDIFSKFPDFSLTWRKICFSLTFPWHVATLHIANVYVHEKLKLKGIVSVLTMNGIMSTVTVACHRVNSHLSRGILSTFKGCLPLTKRIVSAQKCHIACLKSFGD